MSIDIYIEMDIAVTASQLYTALLATGAEIYSPATDGPTGTYAACEMPFWFHKFPGTEPLRASDPQFWEHIPIEMRPARGVGAEIFEMEIASELNLSPKYSTFDAALLVLEKLANSLNQATDGDFVISDEHETILSVCRRKKLLIVDRRRVP